MITNKELQLLRENIGKCSTAKVILAPSNKEIEIKGIIGIHSAGIQTENYSCYSDNWIDINGFSVQSVNYVYDVKIHNIHL